MGQGSHGAGKLAHAHILGGAFEALDVSLRLGIPISQLEAEGNWLGVNAVGAANHRDILELPGAAFEHFGKPFEIGSNDGRCLPDEQSLCGIDHVVGSEAPVKPSRLGADDLGNCRGEGDHVVAHLGFDFVNALQVEIGTFANGARSILWDHTGLSEGFGGGNFDGQPGAKAIFVTPDAAHVWAGVARDHGCVASIVCSE